VTDPRELNVALSSSTAAIVLKMLAKKPEERYPSISSLREDLEAVLDGRPPRNTIELGVKRVSGSVRVEVTDPSSRRERIIEGRGRSKTPMFLGIALVIAAAAVVVVLNPFGKKEPAPEPDRADQPVDPRPKEPTEEDRAEEAYRAAVDWCEKNSGEGFEAQIEKYKAVADRYPESRWGLHAKERIGEIEERRDEGIRRRQEMAQTVYDQTLARAKAMAAEKRYGEALAELDSYPAEYADTEFQELLQRDGKRFVKQAEEEYAEVLEKADYEVSAGRPGDAIVLLEPFLEYGVPALRTKVEARLADIRKERDRQQEAREKGRVAFRAAVGEAFLRASRGEWSEARNHLVEAQEKSELSWYGEDLSRIDAQLRAAIRFDAALQKGADALVGKVVTFKVLDADRDEVAGKVLEVSALGLRMSRTGGSRDVPFADLAAEERVRLAFGVLDNDSVDDHRSAALYLCIHSQFRAADEEIEAARILGADVEEVTATKTLYTSFLKDHAERFVRKALLRINQERWKEALEFADQAVERTPWYGRPRFIRGQVLVKLERTEDAIAALSRALDLGEKDPEVHYWLGEAWLAEENASKALESYTKFADLADNGERLEMVRARINELRARALAERIEGLKEEAKKAQRKKDWARVAAIYREVLELDPKDIETMYLLGKAELEKKDILSAYAALKRFLDADPRGRSASDAKKLLRHLTKTYTETKDTKGYLSDADGQYRAGRYQGAVSLCDLAIEEAPLNEDAYYSRAMAHYRLGQRKEDQAEFAACLEDLRAVEILNPTQALVQELRAIVFYYLKKPDEAYRNAEIAMEKLPERWQSYNVAGLILKEQGRHQKAIEVLSLGIRKDPGVAVLYQNRALAWESLERYERALADVQTALEKKPTSNQMKALIEMRDRIMEAKKKR
jgi:predicted Zn-dependent protease